MARAIGDRLTCIFVDHGFMRKNELAEIKEAFKDINLICVDAKEQFMSRLSGVTSPEEKRKIIGEEFIRVFEREAKKLNNSGSISSERVDFFVQGTIYPDIIESGMGSSSVIKSHHNVGGLPEHIDFKAIIEPLKLLFKNEVRELGTHLGLDERLVKRQPFPGPGLAVRVIGELTKEKLDILREADCVFRNVIEESELDRNINQYFAVLTPLRSVGVRNNERTYEYTVALRAVVTTDFVTADFAKIPYDVLEKASVRIVNECKNINRVVYDITSKPPATIEWE
jgi:GMP synthase (glutamine-hydrolysing)